jgi:hypothetical protein
MKLHLTLITSSLILSACGGGGDAPSIAVATKPIDYLAYHYAASELQTISAKLNDSGVGISSPIIPKGSFTYDANGQYNWGNGLSGGSAVYRLPENPHLPFAAMLCEPGLGGVKDKKGTYVLIAANASKVSSAIELAGQHFETSVSDCDDTRIEQLSFDALGNMTRTTFHYPNSLGVSLVYSPADFQQMQTGLVILGHSTRLQAFKLVSEGKTRYIMVEQDKSLNGDGKDSIYLWKQ